MSGSSAGGTGTYGVLRAAGPDALHPMPCPLPPSLYTLHPALRSTYTLGATPYPNLKRIPSFAPQVTARGHTPYTLYPIPYTLYPIPYSLYRTSDIVHPTR